MHKKPIGGRCINMLATRISKSLGANGHLFSLGLLVLMVFCMARYVPEMYGGAGNFRIKTKTMEV